MPNNHINIMIAHQLLKSVQEEWHKVGINMSQFLLIATLYQNNLTAHCDLLTAS
jgi:hypothetical protein